jgi:hypothetical protein
VSLVVFRAPLQHIPFAKMLPVENLFLLSSRFTTLSPAVGGKHKLRLQDLVVLFPVKIGENQTFVAKLSKGSNSILITIHFHKFSTVTFNSD